MCRQSRNLLVIRRLLILLIYCNRDIYIQVLFKATAYLGLSGTSRKVCQERECVVAQVAMQNGLNA
jgi:hypothetical protein